MASPQNIGDHVYDTETPIKANPQFDTVIKIDNAGSQLASQAHSQEKLVNLPQKLDLEDNNIICLDQSNFKDKSQEINTKNEVKSNITIEKDSKNQQKPAEIIQKNTQQQLQQQKIQNNNNNQDQEQEGSHRSDHEEYQPSSRNDDEDFEDFEDFNDQNQNQAEKNKKNDKNMQNNVSEVDEFQVNLKKIFTYQFSVESENKKLKEKQEKTKQISFQACNFILNLGVYLFLVLGFIIGNEDSSLQLSFMILFGIFYIMYIAECFQSEIYKYQNNIITRNEIQKYIIMLKNGQPEITVTVNGQAITESGGKHNVFHEKRNLKINKTTDLSNFSILYPFLKENKVFRVKTKLICNIADKSLEILQSIMDKQAKQEGATFVESKTSYKLQGIQDYLIFDAGLTQLSGFYKKQMFLFISFIGFSWIYRIIFQKKLSLCELGLQKIINSKL